MKRITSYQPVTLSPENLIPRNTLLVPLQAAPLILLTAPPGYGKTTLLTSLAYHTKHPVCSVHLTERERDSQQFIEILATTIAQTFPTLHPFIPSMWPKRPQEMAKVLADLCRRHLPGPFWLMLDDGHQLLGSEAEPLLYFILTHFTTLGQVALASRRPFPLPTPLQMKATILTETDLRFSPTELHQVLIARFPRHNIPLTLAETVLTDTEGWPLATLLLATPHYASWHKRRVYPLFKAVLADLPPSLTDFIEQTAWLDALNASFCESILGAGDWETALEGVVAHNTFITQSTVAGTTWYQYHPLLRHYLRQGTPPPERLADRLALASHYATHHHWPAACAIYQELDEMPALADLLEAVGFQAFKDGQQEVLLNWIDALPKDHLTNYPKLLSLKGIIETNFGRVWLGLTCQTQAVEQFRQTKHLKNLANALAWRAVSHRFLGDYPASLQDAEEALTLAIDKPDLAEILAKSCRGKGFALYYSEQSLETIDWLKKALTVYRQLGEADWAALLAQDIGMIYTNRHKYNRALFYYQVAEAYWEVKQNNYRLACLKNDMGVLYFFEGQYRQALQTLEKAVVLARESHHQRIEGVALAGLGDLYACLAQDEAASEAYFQAYYLTIQIGSNFLEVYITVAQLWLACATHNTSEMDAYATEVGQLSCQTNYERGLVHLGLGYYSFVNQDYNKAQHHLTQAVTLLTPTGQVLETRRAQLLLACTHFLNGQPFVFDEVAVHPGLMVIAYRHKPVLEAMGLTHVLTHFEQFKQILPTLTKDIREQAKVIPLPAAHLAVYGFGHSRVLLNGVPVIWKTITSKALFFRLIALRERLTQEEIGVLFWPDGSPDQIKQNVTQLIYRLRQVVGKETILFSDNTYYFNPGCDYEYDVEIYNKYLKQARELKKEPLKQITYLDKAVNLYQKPFSGLTDEWVVTESRYLAESCLQGLHDLGTFYFERYEYRPALSYCHDMLRIDETYTEAHHLLLRIYERRKAYWQLRQHYNHYHTILQKYALPPHPE